jgi:predicted lipoprotein with Yx(FWY)xxD motif
MLAQRRSMSMLVVGGSLALTAGLLPALPAAATTAAPAKVAKVTTLHVHKTPIGKRVTGKHGRTVYMFSIDTSKKSNCHKKCRQTWRPVTSRHAPKAGAHISKSKLGRIAHHQVTYNGHPLYYYVGPTGDTGKAQANGEFVFKFGGYWYTLSKKGRQD